MADKEIQAEQKPDPEISKKLNTHFEKFVAETQPGIPEFAKKSLLKAAEKAHDDLMVQGGYKGLVAGHEKMNEICDKACKEANIKDPKIAIVDETSPSEGFQVTKVTITGTHKETGKEVDVPLKGLELAAFGNAMEMANNAELMLYRGVRQSIIDNVELQKLSTTAAILIKDGAENAAEIEAREKVDAKDRQTSITPKPFLGGQMEKALADYKAGAGEITTEPQDAKLLALANRPSFGIAS